MENKIFAVAFIAGIFSAFFLGYLLWGFVTWIFTDPLHIIHHITPMQVNEPPERQKCRDLGGYPITDGWGKMTECKKIEVK